MEGTGVTLTSSSRATTLRIKLTDPRDHPGLRDHFLRLGASVAASTDGATLDVEFPNGLLDEDESAEMYYETWARRHRLDARVAVENGGLSAPEPNGVLKVAAQGVRSQRAPASAAWGVTRQEGVDHL